MFQWMEHNSLKDAQKMLLCVGELYTYSLTENLFQQWAFPADCRTDSPGGILTSAQNSIDASGVSYVIKNRPTGQAYKIRALMQSFFKLCDLQQAAEWVGHKNQAVFNLLTAKFLPCSSPTHTHLHMHTPSPVNRTLTATINILLINSRTNPDGTG